MVSVVSSTEKKSILILPNIETSVHNVELILFPVLVFVIFLLKMRLFINNQLSSHYVNKDPPPIHLPVSSPPGKPPFSYAHWNLHLIIILI